MENIDRVNHPSHYTWLKELCGIEVIDITRHMNFNLGNVIKYVLRSGRKSEEGISDEQKRIEDLKKAIFYLNDEIYGLKNDKEENKKLRLLVTTICPNKCPLYWNNSWDFSKLPVVNRWNYDEIMLTGGEPLLFLDEVVTLAKSIKSIAKAEGNNPKLYAHTAIPYIGNIAYTIRHIDGIVLTLHNLSDIPKFINLNNAMRYNDSFNGKSMRLNLFPNIKEALPKDIDLSMWQIKDMEWTKDYPTSKREDFRRVSELWSK